MKKILQTIIPAALLSVGLMVTATANAQTAQEAHASTVTTKKVTYACSGKKPVKVTYGFNKQGLPTYAQAVFNGKARFMPINLDHSDLVGTMFGEENSYTLNTEAITVKNYKKSTISVMTPASEIIYKNCKSKG